MNCNSYSTEAQFLSRQLNWIENKLAPPKTLEEIQESVILSQHDIIFWRWNDSEYANLAKEVWEINKHTLFTKEIESLLSKSLLEEYWYLKKFPKHINNLEQLFWINNFQIILDISEDFKDTQIWKFFIQNIDNLYDNNNLDKKNIIGTIENWDWNIHFTWNFNWNEKEKEKKSKLFKDELIPIINTWFNNIQSSISIQDEIDHDKLTGLKSRKYWDITATLMLKNAEKDESTFSLFFIDLDHFKYINDTYWHEAWDNILKKSAKKIEAIAKSYWGFAARWWWEEFSIAINNLSKEEAEKIWNEIKYEINNMGNYLECWEEVIGVSIWVEYVDTKIKKDIKLWKIFEKADKKMYIAKRTWRNQVIIELQEIEKTKCEDFSFSDDKKDINPELQKIKLKKDRKDIKKIISDSKSKIEEWEMLWSLWIRYSNTPILVDILVEYLNKYKKGVYTYPKVYLEILRFLWLSEDLKWDREIWENIKHSDSAIVQIINTNGIYSYSFTENNPFHFDAYWNEIKK